MPERFRKPTRILMPTDLSSSARGALRYAAAMADLYGAELHVLHVLTVHDYDPVAARQALAEVQEALEQLEVLMARQVEAEVAGAEQRSGLLIRSATVRSVTAYDAILGYAQANGCDQIVMGTHGRTGLSYVLLGSVTEKTVLHARVPVLVVKEHRRNFVSEDGRIALRRIMYCTDLSNGSRLASARAHHLASEHNAELLVAHVVPSLRASPSAPLDMESMDNQPMEIQEETEAVHQEAKALFGDLGGIEVDVRTGPVAKTLGEVAKLRDVDLILISSQGRHGVKDQLLGSVAERLVRLAPCPICVVKENPEPKG